MNTKTVERTVLKLKSSGQYLSVDMKGRIVLTDDNKTAISSNNEKRYAQAVNMFNDDLAIETISFEKEVYTPSKIDYTEEFNNNLAAVKNGFLNTTTKDELYYSYNFNDSAVVESNYTLVVKAFVKYIENEFKAERVHTSSKNGSKFNSSVYLTLNGIECRISDHDLPEINHRKDDNYSSRWNNEVILNARSRMSLLQMSKEQLNDYIIKEMFC